MYGEYRTNILTGNERACSCSYPHISFNSESHSIVVYVSTIHRRLQSVCGSSRHVRAQLRNMANAITFAQQVVCKKGCVACDNIATNIFVCVENQRQVLIDVISSALIRAEQRVVCGHTRHTNTSGQTASHLLNKSHLCDGCVIQCVRSAKLSEDIVGRQKHNTKAWRIIVFECCSVLYGSCRSCSCNLCTHMYSVVRNSW